MNVSVREFTNKLWYTTDIVIINKGNKIFNQTADLYKIKAAAIWNGSNEQLRSITAERVNDMTVAGYGVIDNTMVIEVYAR